VLSCAVLEDAALLRDVTTGRITDAQWRTVLSDRLHASHGDAGPEAVRRWSRSPGLVVAEVLEIVRAARLRFTVALLSNATTRLEHDLASLGLDGEFDAVFNSSRLGVAKPDPSIFQIACARLGTAPGQCAFIDDSLPNVEAAERAGMIGHQFTDHRSLRDFLDGLTADLTHPQPALSVSVPPTYEGKVHADQRGCP
jgi:putative hydrolase of the HAD superfamily